jgi:hypothetical protein
VSGCHAISARLDNRDLYLWLCDRHRRGLLLEEGDGHSGVDEGGMF